jgi:hypothetical protein
MRSANYVIVGWPDIHERRTVKRRADGKLLGYIRSVDGRWYFAENTDMFPVEGTYRTRNRALWALLGTLDAGGRG